MVQNPEKGQLIKSGRLLLMLHSDRDNFLRVLESTSAKTGFSLLLLEKDYFLTLLLSDINGLSESLVFKGGTCLNKIYYSYYRLSEDLDFTMILPEGKVIRAARQKIIKPVKENLQNLVKNYDMSIEGVEGSGRNESSQYIFPLKYKSVVLNTDQFIKLEIGLRFNPVLPVQKQKINHKFIHPFTKEPLFDAGSVNCLDLKEIVAEKLRATATRLTIAPRDFYDIGFLIKNGYDFRDKGLWELFKRKLSEDKFDSDLSKYKINLGRSEKEIKDMNSRITSELLDVLTPDEKKNFNLGLTIESINSIFRDIIN
jgi:predicted nucleotidyltransferase component of viral defense system